MEAQPEVDANKTLAEVVKSKDTRLWEGFAVLLANTARDYHFEKDTEFGRYHALDLYTILSTTTEKEWGQELFPVTTETS